MKRLIVNADDLGRTPGINAGVVEAHLQGIVTSATVMVLERAAAQGVADVIHRAPRLSLGLHFALTGGGLPASTPGRVRSLLSGGRFRRFPSDLPEALEPDEVTELMCHPGHVDRGLLSASTYARERESELAVLCDPGLKALLAEQGVRLVSFRDL